jgi:hypothetical protein
MRFPGFTEDASGTEENLFVVTEGQKVGMIYWIREREAVRCREAVYKVGRTVITVGQDRIDRLGAYKNGSELLFIWQCPDAAITQEVEVRIIQEFRKRFERIEGREYFRGNRFLMSRVITSITREYDDLFYEKHLANSTVDEGPRESDDPVTHFIKKRIEIVDPAKEPGHYLKLPAIIDGYKRHTDVPYQARKGTLAQFKETFINALAKLGIEFKGDGFPTSYTWVDADNKITQITNTRSFFPNIKFKAIADDGVTNDEVVLKSGLKRKDLDFTAPLLKKKR